MEGPAGADFDSTSIAHDVYGSFGSRNSIIVSPFWQHHPNDPRVCIRCMYRPYGSRMKLNHEDSKGFFLVPAILL